MDGPARGYYNLFYNVCWRVRYPPQSVIRYAGTRMSVSRLQEPFLRELATNFVATQRRIIRRLAEVQPSDISARDAVLRDELRGLYHGVLVILDGGTALADQGLINIVDEDGVPFQRWLHELCFEYWPPEVPA